MNSKPAPDIAVTDLLPQRPPFVMVDRLTAFDGVATATELTVRPGNIFVEDGRLTAAGLVENVAQTCAARIGYVCHINNRPVSIGYIGAIRNFEVARLPRVGERLSTVVTVRGEAFGMTLVDAVVKAGGETIATGEMKTAVSDPGKKEEGGNE